MTMSTPDVIDRKEKRPLLPVEKGIPISEPIKAFKRRKSTMRFPWRLMDVGDSFFVPLDGQDSVRLRNTIRRSKVSMKGIEGRTYAARVVAGGVRVWRTK